MPPLAWLASRIFSTFGTSLCLSKGPACEHAQADNSVRNWCVLCRIAGKTTLLRLVAGLELPTGGKIYFDDLDATDLAVQDRQVSRSYLGSSCSSSSSSYSSGISGAAAAAAGVAEACDLAVQDRQVRRGCINRSSSSSGGSSSCSSSGGT
jgi:hypothetical protein